MTPAELEKDIDRFVSAGPAAVGDPSAMEVFLQFRSALEKGQIRSASPDGTAPTGWRVNVWVKQGILLGFRLGALQDMSDGGFAFVDKGTYPARRIAVRD